MNSSDVGFLRGEIVHYASSPAVVRSFCGQCGTSLTYKRTATPDILDVTTASIDAAGDFAPTKEIWVSEKLEWERLNESLPSYSQGSAGNRPIDPVG